MDTPVTPNPMAARKAHEARLAAEAEKANELDRQIEGLGQKLGLTESRLAHKTSQERKRYENRKRAQELKKKGLSNVEIAKTMRVAESTVRTLLKPYEPKPHLTQRIEGLEVLKSKADHPAGRGKNRNGGK